MYIYDQMRANSFCLVPIFGGGGGALWWREKGEGGPGVEKRAGVLGREGHFCLSKLLIFFQRTVSHNSPLS